MSERDDTDPPEPAATLTLAPTEVDRLSAATHVS